MDKILVVDDEQTQREILTDILTDSGYSVKTAANGEEALALVESESFAVILTDLKMPKMDGLQLLDEIQKSYAQTQVVIMTAFGSIPSAVNAIKTGAYDYITKPFKKEDILLVIKRALDKARLISENSRLKDELSHKYNYHNLIGKSAAMRKVFHLIDKIKNVDATVLISGESGTGKEVVARAIHHSSGRKDEPFIALNCGAIPENLIESELFGHEKGAFTGAHYNYKGKFLEANRGTLLLDEIGTMRPDLQIRLLRVLQDKKITPLGSAKSIELDVRVIAATNEDLEAKIEDKTFRLDLFHRLNLFAIHLPPLRERRDDIPLLVNHFMDKFSSRYDKPKPKLEQQTFSRLEHYPFPGNIRELENIIEKAIILTENTILTEESLWFPQAEDLIAVEDSENRSLPDIEKKMIVKVLAQTRGSLKRTSVLLGISYKTLQYRIKKYGINKDDFK